jgi:hypothetical protein
MYMVGGLLLAAMLLSMSWLVSAQNAHIVREKQHPVEIAAPLTGYVVTGTLRLQDGSGAPIMCWVTDDAVDCSLIENIPK